MRNDRDREPTPQRELPKSGPAPRRVVGSESIAKLTAAMRAARRLIAPIVKDHTNSFTKSSYAGLGAVLKAIEDGLDSNGLLVLHATRWEEGELWLDTTIEHESGEWIAGVYPLFSDYLDPQRIGSALTYARRYVVLSMLSLAPEDDDGETAMGRGQGRQDQRRQEPGHDRRPEASEGRRAVNEQFPRRETWADYSRERLRVANADWMQEMVRRGVDPARRAEHKEISNEPREVNQICTRLIEMGRLTATAIAKDGDPAARDPKKARDVVVRLFESKPASVKRAVEKHLAENLGKARANLGLTEADADDDGAMYPDEVTVN